MMSTPIDPATVLAALNHGVYVVDVDRRITYWNAAATEVAGYSAQEAVGTRCNDALLDHVDGDGRTLCGDRCPLQQTIADGVDRTLRVYLHHKDGPLKPVQMSAAALRDASGAIVGAVETFSDDTDFHVTRSRAAELERLSLIDPLTGVGNRRHLDSSLARMLGGPSDGTRVGVLMIDVDHFKVVNDTHGHAVGDAALRAIASTLCYGVRADDVVARYGGEEFVVLTKVDDGAQLLRLAERLRILVRGTRVDVPRRMVRVTASVGAALSRPGDHAPTVLHRADKGLLRAKRKGRNRVVLV